MAKILTHLGLSATPISGAAIRSIPNDLIANRYPIQSGSAPEPTLPLRLHSPETVLSFPTYFKVASGATSMSLVTEFKSMLPPSVRRYTKVLYKQIRKYTGVLPDFIIIGAKKCGTTSLYNYLIQHPCIYRASRKEVGYFDRYYSGDLNWYRSHFPPYFRKCYSQSILKRSFITGEASTGYILNPHALRRIAHIIPKTKLILLLRNPVDRAYSHYQDTLRAGKETLSFEDALDQETERIGNIWTNMLEDEQYYSQIAFHAYLMTGTYINQVEVLTRLFPRDQVLILENEQLSRSPNGVLNQVLSFLDVSPWKFRNFEKHNSGSYPKMAEATRARLVEYYKPYNKSLYNYLGVKYDWDR